MAEVKAKEVKTVEPVKEDTPVAKNEGSEIAQAISEGLKNATGKKGFEVVVDDSIEHRFAVVKNAEGEIMIRENETGVLSKVQLRSLEEKQALLQSQKVEEVQYTIRQEHACSHSGVFLFDFTRDVCI